MKKKRRSREKTGGNSSSVKGYFSISKLNFSVQKKNYHPILLRPAAVYQAVERYAAAA